jgi:hypothetical protein
LGFCRRLILVSQKSKGDSIASGNKYEVDKEESSKHDYDEDRTTVRKTTRRGGLEK